MHMPANMLPLFLALLFGGLGLFLLLAAVLRWELVDGWWQRLWGEWSSRLQLGGILSLLSMLPVDPVTGLSLWNQMPREVREVVPARFLYPLAIVLFILAWLAKYAAQRKLQAKVQAKAKAKAKGTKTNG